MDYKQLTLDRCEDEKLFKQSEEAWLNFEIDHGEMKFLAEELHILIVLWFRGKTWCYDRTV